MPVKLHPAVREARIELHLLHKRDHVRLRQQMVCAYEKVAVPREEQVRGFELEDGKYILVDPEELEQIEPEDSRVIAVHEFVKSGQIDPLYFDRAYYLGPDSDSRGYNALVGVLREADVQGICTWTMRKRSYLGAVQARGRILCMNVLRYADEVISVKSLDLGHIPLSEKELSIGCDLIDRLTVPFQPEKFENEHEKKLQALIDRKARGERIAILHPLRLKPTKPDTLLETLEASLRKVG